MNIAHLLQQAKELRTPRERERFLEEACGTDLALLQEVRRRLAEEPPGQPPPAPPPPPPNTTCDGAGPGFGHRETDAGDLAYAVASDADLEVNEVVADRFKIRERLGAGGMGAVYAADQLAPVQRRVAVKIIKAGMDSAQVLSRFAQERQALALMAHPNIARIFDGGVTRAGRPFFVMELVRGLPLTQFCDQKKLSLRERIALFLPVCRAVQHAHQKGIIHRDLKPSNILVGEEDGKPAAKIIDFGVAKALHPGLGEESVYTAQNTLVGTLEYMAPEQAALNNLDVDTRADIYSLGVVLYELLCGALPFSRRDQLSGSLDEIIRVLREVEPKKPSTRVTAVKEPDTVAARRRLDVPHLQRQLKGDLDWVVMKCLEKERERRYASAAGLAADLERFLREEPVLAAPPSARYRLGKFLKRHRGKAALAAGAVLLLAAAAGAATIGWRRAVHAEELARQEAERAARAEVAAKDEAARAVKAEKEAKEEAAVHQALTAFIQRDLFGAAEPAERARLGLPLDAEIPLRALIDRAAGQLDRGLFAEQPLVQSALHLTFARAYVALGLFDEARPHADHGDELLRTALGPKDGRRLEALELCGRIHDAMGRAAEAQACYAEALAALRDVGRGERPEALELRFLLARLQWSRGELAAAEASLKALHEDQARLQGRTHEACLNTRHALADVLIGQQRLEDAEAALESLAADARRFLSKDHPLTLGVLNSAAHVKRLRKQLDDAARRYAELVEAATRVRSGDHPITAVYKNNYAVCLIDMGKHADALALLLQVEPVFERVGPTHRLTLVMKSNLASTLASLGRRAEALRRYEALLPQFSERFGEGDLRLWLLLSRMAEVQEAEGQLQPAARTVERLLRGLRSKRPPMPKETAFTALRLAGLRTRLGQGPEAAALLAEVAAELPADSPARKQVEKRLEELRKEP